MFRSLLVLVICLLACSIVSARQSTLQHETVGAKASFVSDKGRTEWKANGDTLEDIADAVRVPKADILAANGNINKQAFDALTGDFIIPDACDKLLHTVATNKDKLLFGLGAYSSSRKALKLDGSKDRLAVVYKRVDDEFDPLVATALTELNPLSKLFKTDKYVAYKNVLAEKQKKLRTEVGKLADVEWGGALDVLTQVCTRNGIMVFGLLTNLPAKGFSDADAASTTAPKYFNWQFAAITPANLFTALKAGAAHNVAVVRMFGGEHVFVIQSRKLGDMNQFRILQSWVKVYTLAQQLGLVAHANDEVNIMVDAVGKGQWLESDDFEALFNAVYDHVSVQDLPNPRTAALAFSELFGPVADLVEIRGYPLAKRQELMAHTGTWSPANCALAATAFEKAFETAAKALH